MNCKICKATAHFFGSIDLAKNCNEQAGFFLPKTGIDVSYFQCGNCEFIFTNYFDQFSAEDWRRVIYNNDYIKVDPLYTIIRPTNNARLFVSLMQTAYIGKPNPKIIDYGAGNGTFCKLLGNDYDVTNFDPHNPSFSSFPEGKFDILFSSEVLEHASSPLQVIHDWKRLLTSNGMVLFSTMLQPDNITTEKTSWWYISPRNGHISIYSQSSIHVLFSQLNMECQPISAEWHIAFHKKSAPQFDFKKLSSLIKALPKGFISMS